MGCQIPVKVTHGFPQEPINVKSMKWIDQETLRIEDDKGRVWVVSGVKIQYPDVASFYERLARDNPEVFQRVEVQWEKFLAEHLDVKEELRKLFVDDLFEETEK